MSEKQRPRANADLVARYMADDRLRCWIWGGKPPSWHEIESPIWGEASYYVGHEPPTEPPQKMCELAGVLFPAPLGPDDRPKETWLVRVDAGVDASTAYYQATKEGAIAQGRAIEAAIKQAIEEAQ